jgi:hypothetical protein
VAVLLSWGFAHVVFAVRWEPERVPNLQAKCVKLLTDSAVLVGLLVLGMGGMTVVFIALVGLFILVCQRILRGRVVSIQESGWH